MGLVDNRAVRHAVTEFAAEPGPRRALEVLRQCMFGELLLDITGSDAPADATFTAGSRLQIRGGTGPDGRRALFAFTSNEQIARLHPPGTRTQSMVTPAVGALELARQQGDGWVYLDPAGPTCALAADEVDFALRNPRNGPLKDALVGFASRTVERRSVIDVLREDGPLLLAADDRSVPGKIGVRSTTLADGASALLSFTSAPEVVAYSPADAVAAMTVPAVLHKMRSDGYGGLVIDPVGPWIALPRSEIDGELRA
jgi:hypothetical protein